MDVKRQLPVGRRYVVRAEARWGILDDWHAPYHWSARGEVRASALTRNLRKFSSICGWEKKGKMN